MDNSSTGGQVISLHILYVTNKICKYSTPIKEASIPVSKGIQLLYLLV